MKAMKAMKAMTGFTLIELMIVIAVIGILVAVAVLPRYQAIHSAARFLLRRRLPLAPWLTN